MLTTAIASNLASQVRSNGSGQEELAFNSVQPLICLLVCKHDNSSTRFYKEDFNPISLKSAQLFTNNRNCLETSQNKVKKRSNGSDEYLVVIYKWGVAKW